VQVPSEDCTYPPQCSDVVKRDALKLFHSAHYSVHLGFTSISAFSYIKRKICDCSMFVLIYGNAEMLVKPKWAL